MGPNRGNIDGNGDYSVITGEDWPFNHLRCLISLLEIMFKGSCGVGGMSEVK